MQEHIKKLRPGSNSLAGVTHFKKFALLMLC